ncbi:MAG: metal-dependent hydrolase [Nitrososphaerales archaeon]
MLTVTHMFWGYVLGRITLNFFKDRNFNPFLLLLCGAIPDFDLISHIVLQRFFAIREPYGTLLGHHGLAHSWLVITVAFLLISLSVGIKAFPYCVATLQHVIFGDFVTNEVPLYFPSSLDQYGLRIYLNEISIALEIFGMVLFLLFLKKDAELFNKPKGFSHLLLLSLPLIFLHLRYSFIYFQEGGLLPLYSLYGILSSILFFSILIPSYLNLYLTKRKAESMDQEEKRSI